MNYLYILVGLPGCGKSSLVRAEAQENDVVLSSDELRVEMYGFEDQTHNGEVFQEMNKRTREAGKAGKTVWYDATNINRKRRVALANEMKKHFSGIRVVMCACPIEDLITRNETREERHLPWEKLKQMIQSIQIPTIHEYPYDDILYVYTGNRDGFMRDIDMSIGMMQLMDYDQNNKYHNETLGKHILRTYDNCGENALAKMAAFWHDMGKPFCRTTDDKGESHYYGHGMVSAYMYLVYTAQMLQEISTFVVMLIEFHDQIFNFNHDIEKMKEQYNEKYLRLYDEFWIALDILTKADRVRGE